jgi:hypothetical protein
VKEQDYARDFVKLDEIRAFPAELLRAQKIAPARCERTASTGYVESVEASEAELAMQEFVGLFLEPSVGTRNHESVRAIGGPLQL